MWIYICGRMWQGDDFRKQLSKAFQAFSTWHSPMCYVGPVWTAPTKAKAVVPKLLRVLPKIGPLLNTDVCY